MKPNHDTRSGRPEDGRENDRMIPKPLHNAAQVLTTLVDSGCQVRVEKDSLVIHDPKRSLTNEVRDEIRKHKLALLTLLLRQSLIQLVRVLDMAQPDIRLGMQEEYTTALLAAMRLVGDPWEGEDEETNFWVEGD